MSESADPSSLDNSYYYSNIGKLESITTEFIEDPAYIEDVTNLTRDWYPDFQLYLSSISNECIRQSAMHNETSKMFDRKNKIILTSLQIIPFFSGIVAFLPFPTIVKDISQGFIALLLVLLASLNRLKKFSDQAKEHRIVSNKYMQLNGTFTFTLLLPVDRRPNGIRFCQWARQTFFLVKTLAPHPSKRVSEKIKKLSDVQDQLPAIPVRDLPDAFINPPNENPLPPLPGGDEIIPAPSEPTLPVEEDPQILQQRIQVQRNNAYTNYLAGRGRLLFQGDAG